MTKIKFSNIFTTILVIGLGIVILLYPRLGLDSQVQIKLVADGINSILKAVSVKARVTQLDVVSGLITTEYIVFGLSLMIMLKTYTQNVIKNISVPLFIGLFLTVLSGYVDKINKSSVVTIDVVIKEFVFVLLGIFVYLIFNRLLESKIKKGNYSRRR